MQNELTVSVPIFPINSTVYLRPSAAIGFVEGFRVETIRYSDAGYPVYVLHPGPYNQSTAPYGDMNTGQVIRRLEIPESELCNYETALDVAILHVQSTLDHLIDLRASVNGTA